MVFTEGSLCIVLGRGLSASAMVLRHVGGLNKDNDNFLRQYFTANWPRIVIKIRVISNALI